MIINQSDLTVIYRDDRKVLKELTPSAGASILLVSPNVSFEIYSNHKAGVMLVNDGILFVIDEKSRVVAVVRRSDIINLNQDTSMILESSSDAELILFDCFLRLAMATMTNVH